MMEPPEEAPNAADKFTGELFGRRVAEAAKRLNCAAWSWRLPAPLRKTRRGESAERGEQP